MAHINPSTSATLAGAGLADPCLPIGRYRLRFDAAGALNRSEYHGSAWRGAFGHALKATVCATGQDQCADCLLYRSCPYPYIFDTPTPPDAPKMRRYPQVPHPFVLTPLDEGATTLALNLFGRGNAMLGYCLHALAQAGEKGIGNQRVVMRLLGAEQVEADTDEWWPIYRGRGPLSASPATAAAIPEPPPGAVTVILETPLRLQRAGRLVGTQDFAFSDLFGNLLRRISMLTCFHTDTPLETHFRALTEHASQIRISRQRLRWYDWQRHSSRQNTFVKMGGLVGEFTLAPAALAPLWPYLWLGQHTHAGKGSSMGLGRYRIETGGTT